MGHVDTLRSQVAPHPMDQMVTPLTGSGGDAAPRGRLPTRKPEVGGPAEKRACKSGLVKKG